MKFAFFMVLLMLATTNCVANNGSYGWADTSYYDSGEIRFICHHHRIPGGSGRGTGRTFKSRFKRIYFDQCGNIRYIASGKAETGCWVFDVKILYSNGKNADLKCKKSIFIKPTDDEIKRGK